MNYSVQNRASGVVVYADTVAAVILLEQAGLLAEGRAAEILA